MAAGLRTGPLTTGGRRREGMSPHGREQIAEVWGLARGDKHAEAAEAFAQLAARADARGDAALAMHLQIEAARAFERAGNADQVAEAGKTAVGYAAKAQARPKAARKLARLVQGLREAEKTDLADALEADAKERLGLSNLPDAKREAPSINRAMRRSLPKSCPTCGMALSAESLELSEDALADCGYCGAPVMA